MRSIDTQCTTQQPGFEIVVDQQNFDGITDLNGQLSRVG